MIDGTEVGTKEDFLKLDLENGLNPYFFVELEEETCREMFCNYQGIMMGATGRVWIADVPVFQRPENHCGQRPKGRLWPSGRRFHTGRRE